MVNSRFGKIRSIIMVADQTVNNSATLVNVTELVMSVKANTNYLVKLLTYYDSSTVADIKLAMVVPSGATEKFAYQNALLSSNITNQGEAAPKYNGYDAIVKIAATAGTIQIQMAQDTAEVSNTKLLIDTTLIVTELR